MRFRLFFLLGSIILLLWGCGMPADYSGRASGTGIGGTGALAEQGTGIGGTGVLAEQGTGIGGTGTFAGKDGDRLGILGRITGFGSIWVNGLEVEFDRDTPVETDSTGIAASRLAKGQVVEVLAKNDSGLVRAEKIGIRYEVIGPVQAISTDRQKIEVLDQQVLLAPDTVLPDSWTGAAAGNTVVRVSGFRDSQGNILASRVEYGDTGDPAHLIGRIDGTAGTPTVSGLPVEMPENTRPVRSGGIVRVSGSLRDGILAARSVRHDRDPLFGAKVDRLLIQAVAVPRNGGGSISLGGMPFRMQGKVPVSDMPHNRPFLFMGTMNKNGGLRLQRVAPSPSLEGASFSPPSMDHPVKGRRQPHSPSMPSRHPGGSMGGHGGRMGR